ncbi:MAG: DUF4199 domain-containing protein [Acidobacteria bacterium]|nr:DUF4199 domain-containing protein [Acidobacteriota bacterium]
MSSIVKAGLFLGITVIIWVFIMGFTGWSLDPALALLFPLVATILNIIAIVWGLRATAAEGRHYGGQILAGLLIGLVASVFIFAGSLLFTTVVFPDYLTQLQEMGRQTYVAQGWNEAEIQAAMEVNAARQTPFWQALSGVIGTMVTSLVVSLITAAFVRAK